MKKSLLLSLNILFILFPRALFAAEDPQEILRKLDRQMFLPGSYFKSRLTITYSKDDTREKMMEGYEQGRDYFFVHFLSPARDKDTRYLKREKVMWLYLPGADKVIQIKGHMLRQGMMGGDFSYEDATENSHLLEDYEPSLLGEEKIEGEDVYILELVAKEKDVTYYRRKLWVSKTTFIPLKSELYAKSGKLLKMGTAGDIRALADRYYPFRATMKDMLKKDTLSVMETLELKIDQKIEPEMFELRNLERR